MRVVDYLHAKYRGPSTTILHAEARALGIPYPPPSGWLKTYGLHEITADGAVRLRAALEHVKDRKPSATDGIRVLNDAWLVLTTVPDATTTAFLRSKAWKRARYNVIRKRRRCECCGRGPADGVVLNVDHIKPRRLFPELALNENNLQVLCDDCNEGKGNWDMTDSRPPP